VTLSLLVDFGFAHYLLGETDAAHNLRGSLLYMAPELLTRQQYNEKADLWSVGVILYGQLFYLYVVFSMLLSDHFLVLYFIDRFIWQVL